MFEDLIYVREEEVDGLGPWYWIKDETGAWAGPKQDWEQSHKHKYFEHVKNRDVVVCAGGNQGMYPRLFAREFKFVFTFEPDPMNFYVLSRNCQQENIIKSQMALGAHGASVGIERQTMVNTGMHKINGDGIIPQIPIDALRLPALDFLQLDVEGYEIHILKGAIEHIRRYKPVIACEQANQDVDNFLRENDYLAVSQSVADTIYIPD